MTRILIAANGTIDTDIITQRLIEFQPDIVIGADGGTDHLLELDYLPDCIIGDLDSLTSETVEDMRSQSVVIDEYPVDKDETDLELALLAAAAYDNPQIVVIAANGGRFDMTLANVFLLSHKALKTTHAEIWQGWQTLRLLHPPGATLSGAPGETVSLIPIKGDIVDITTTGLKYPLNGATLDFGPARGVSNVLTEYEAHITFTSGLLLSVHTKGELA